MRRRTTSGKAGSFGFGRKLQQAVARNQRIAAEVSRVLDAARRPDGGSGGKEAGGSSGPGGTAKKPQE